MARALYICGNVGHEADAVDMRAMYACGNVGHEADSVDSRALYACGNVGHEADAVDLRALYTCGAVVMRTGIDDPLEVLLVQADMVQVDAILRAR